MTTALAMLYVAARGDTAVEMATALHYVLQSEKLHPMLNKLDLELAARNQTLDDDDEFQLRIANDLWLRKDYPIVPEYLDTIGVNYGAGVRVLDFQKDFTNTVYFKAKWEEEFEKSATAPQPFTNIDGSSSQVPMMRNTGSYNSSQTDEYDAAELPYRGQEVAMLIVMPKSGTFAAQQTALDAESSKRSRTVSRPAKSIFRCPSSNIRESWI